VVTGAEAKCWLGVPMIFQDRVIGVMTVQSTRKAGLYDEDHERLLSAMANQAASAVVNARAYSALERKLTELSVFNEVGRALGSTLQLDELMDVIYNQTSRIMDTESFYVALYDEKSNTVEFPLFIVDEGKRLDIAPKEFGNGLTEYVITSRKPLFLKEDVVESSRKLGIDMWVVDGETPQSWLGVPMISHDKVVGVMSVQSTLQANRYDEDQKRFLEAIANQAAGAVANARAYSELERKLTELSVFNEISRALGSTLRLDELLDVIYAQITRIMKGESFYIALYDADKSTIAFPLYVDDGKQKELSARPFGKGLTEHVISTREPLLIKEDVTEIASKLGVDSVRHGDPALSWLGVPMISQDRIIGVMTVQSTRKAGLYDEDHQRLLSAIANQAASAVVNARAYEVLEQRVAERTVELEEKLALIQQQRAAILELSTPAIKVWDGVLVIPLIGALDTRRSQQLTEELLSAIANTQSQIAIIDITGVPTVDSAVANHLLKTVESVNLLGAKCVITGIRPEVAQTIIHLGIDLSNIETLSTLAEGLKWAFKSLRNVK
jgi:anti-anti-sigma factor